MTERSAFVLSVRLERMEDYLAAHRAVWPELLEALRAAGVRNYTIFRAGSHVFGYFESDDVAAAERYLAGQDVNARWQNAMAELLDERVPTTGAAHLEEIFRLD